MKPFIKYHLTGEDAIERTKKNNVIAVKIVTYYGEVIHSTNFYSYKTKWNGNIEELREDFPYCLGSNQLITEIDANDY